jgi:hypothetical protein
MSAAQKAKDDSMNMDKYKDVSAEEIALPMYQKMLAELIRAPGAAPTAPATMPTDRAAQFKVMR